MSPSLPKPKILWRHWDIVEKRIREEKNWLEFAIDTFSKEEKNAPTGCRECFLRKIAILIISGKVKAKEIKKSPKLKSFWLNKKGSKIKNKKKIYHGSGWHKETMKKIEDHFLSLGYKVVREPDLNYGRADLGIYKKAERDLLIEVGTTSFYKLWRNLETMKHFTYLIIPNDDKLIEFTCS